MTDEADSQLNEAISLAKSGEYDAARRLLRQIIAEDRDNHEAQGWLMFVESKTRPAGDLEIVVGASMPEMPQLNFHDWFRACVRAFVWTLLREAVYHLLAFVIFLIVVLYVLHKLSL
jgi:hypothetical protein